MTAAIIKCRPIYVVEGFPDEESFEFTNAPSVNEQLALSVGLSMLRAYILADKSEVDRHQYFVQKDFFVPQTFSDNDTNNYGFDILFVWSLYYANVVNGLCTPLLADIYFLLDRYHEMYFKLTKSK